MQPRTVYYKKFGIGQKFISFNYWTVILVRVADYNWTFYFILFSSIFIQIIINTAIQWGRWSGGTMSLLLNDIIKT